MLAEGNKKEVTAISPCVGNDAYVKKKEVDSGQIETNPGTANRDNSGGRTKEKLLTNSRNAWGVRASG